METKLEGKIYSFVHEKGFGFILVPNPEDERTPAKFFIHINRIISGAEYVAVGATVRFFVSPIREGKLPSAIDAEIVKGGDC